MSYSKQDIQKLLHAIPASPVDIYQWFADQRLVFSTRKMWGFPVRDFKNPKKISASPDSHNHFSSSTDPNAQTCRCGKIVSLLKEDWYKDDAGCSYHPGKRTYCGGPDYGLYTCCKRVSKNDACMHHKYHVCSYKSTGDNIFVETDTKKRGRIDTSNVFALDTEMVYTAAGLEVARVSLVSVNGDIIFDEYVQPENLILDYNTTFSGISAEHLDGVETTLADVQALFLQVLNQDSILIGHGLENDLVATRLMHEYVVDTSLVYSHEKGFPYRHSLKTLSLKYLNKKIHSDRAGHNSVEDALICVALMLKKFSLHPKKPFFNYTPPKPHASPPILQETLKFYARTPPPNYFFPLLNYSLKPAQVITSQTIPVRLMIPNLWLVSQIFPMSLNSSIIYPTLTL